MEKNTYIGIRERHLKALDRWTWIQYPIITGKSVRYKIYTYIIYILPQLFHETKEVRKEIYQHMITIYLQKEHETILPRLLYIPLPD